MANKIKEIHQYSNGVWGDGVPIGADAENIDVDMGEGVTKSLQEILGTPSPTPIQTQINELNANKVSTNGGDVANTIVGDQIPIYDTSTQETSEELINTNPSEHSEVIAMQGDTTDTLWGKFNRFRRRVDNKFKNYLVKSIGTGTGYDDNHAYSAKALNTYFANVIGYTAGTTPTAGKISDQLSSLNSKTANLPNASAITAGTFAAARIPNLDAGKITSGTLGADRIPNLNASKITAGTLGVDRIPNLAASKITSGTLDVGRIPRLTLAKLPESAIRLKQARTTGQYIDANAAKTFTISAPTVSGYTRQILNWAVAGTGSSAVVIYTAYFDSNNIKLNARNHGTSKVGPIDLAINYMLVNNYMVS